MSLSYEVVGSQRIALKFYSASLDDVQISPLVESLLAPAFLPRTGVNHQLLLAIREVTRIALTWRETQMLFADSFLCPCR